MVQEPEGLRGAPTEGPVEDPRIESALAWCRAQGIGGLTVAAPFPLRPTVVPALLSHPAILSLVVSESVAPEVGRARVGVFLPAEYTWRLPQTVGTRLVFVGPRTRISAAMLKTGLQAGVTAFVYWDIDRWAVSTVWSLLVGKLASKLGAAVQRVAEMPFIPRAARLPPAADALFRRRFSRALDAATELGALPPVPGRVVIACPTLVAGGAERQIVNTALGLVGRGRCDVSLLVASLHSRPGNDFFLGPLLAAGVPVREATGPTDSLDEWDHYHRSFQVAHRTGRLRVLLDGLPQSMLQDVVNCYVAIRELRPSVVHCWLDYTNVRAGLAALLAGVPCVVLSGRNVCPVHFPYILEPYMRAAYQAMAARPEVIFVNNSRAGADDYAAWLRLPRSRFHVVYNGVDSISTQRPSPGQVLKFRGLHDIHPGAQVLGGMFRFSEEKRPLLWLETAIRLTSVHPNLYCLLFGEGPLQSDMERLIAGSGAGSRIRLAVPTSESALALSGFDVLLLTSLWEGTPNVAIEAQALGVPVVATGGGGIREALQHGMSGLFVEEPTAATLAAAVASLLSNPTLRSEMARAGPGFVNERFSLDRMLHDTVGIYQLCDSSGVPSN